MDTDIVLSIVFLVSLFSFLMSLLIFLFIVIVAEKKPNGLLFCVMVVFGLVTLLLTGPVKEIDKKQQQKATTDTVETIDY